MEARKLLKQAFQKTPKTDTIDRLYKAAQAAPSWYDLVRDDKEISKYIASLRNAGMENEAIRAINASVSGGAATPLVEQFRGPTLRALQEKGFLPSYSEPFSVRAKKTVSNALLNGLPVLAGGLMTAGIGYVSSAIASRRAKKQMEEKGSNLAKDLAKTPEFKAFGPERIQQVIDVYSTVNPDIVNQPLLLKAMLRDAGTPEAAVNPQFIKTLGEMYASKQRTMAEVEKVLPSVTTISKNPQQLATIFKK